MNILLLYNGSQTFTKTVFEHVDSFQRFSKNNVWYKHVDSLSSNDVDFEIFDCVGIHYTIRLAFDQMPKILANKLTSFNGLKFLFIQDEYDNIYKIWHWINELKINLFFTVMPNKSIETFYPKEKFPNTDFVSNLTGYVPEDTEMDREFLPPSKRSIIVGYRGRNIPLKYGQLGFDKVNIGRIAKNYFDSNNIKNDIAWEETDRIYGNYWYEFIANCRSVLGTESGSNVLDYEGVIDDEIRDYTRRNKNATEEEIYINVIKPKEIDGLTNQISPKIFEAIQFRTALILFEGEYSNIIEKDTHYISLKKDGSNFDEVKERLLDKNYIDSLVERAWNDIIKKEKYSYKSFIDFFDRTINQKIIVLNKSNSKNNIELSKFEIDSSVTIEPLDSVLIKKRNVELIQKNYSLSSRPFLAQVNFSETKFFKFLLFFWKRIPDRIRIRLRKKIIKSFTLLHKIRYQVRNLLRSIQLVMTFYFPYYIRLTIARINHLLREVFIFILWKRIPLSLRNFFKKSK